MDFITDIDINTWSMRYASAGHPDQYIVRGGDVTVLSRTGKIVGFGRDLVEHVIALARSQGLARVDLGFHAASLDLRAWYEKLGFVWKRVERPPHLPFEIGFMSLALAGPET